MLDDFPNALLASGLDAQHIHACRVARKVEIDTFAGQRLAADDGTRGCAEHGLKPRALGGVAHSDGELPISGVGIECHFEARQRVGRRG